MLRNDFIVLLDDDKFDVSEVIELIYCKVIKSQSFGYFIITSRPKNFFGLCNNTWNKLWKTTVHPLRYTTGIFEPCESVIFSYNTKLVITWSRSISSKYFYNSLTAKECLYNLLKPFWFDCYMCVCITVLFPNLSVCHFEFGYSYSQEINNLHYTEGVISFIKSYIWDTSYSHQTNLISSSLGKWTLGIGLQTGCNIINNGITPCNWIGIGWIVTQYKNNNFNKKIIINPNSERLPIHLYPEDQNEADSSNNYITIPPPISWLSIVIPYYNKKKINIIPIVLNKPILNKRLSKTKRKTMTPEQIVNYFKMNEIRHEEICNKIIIEEQNAKLLAIKQAEKQDLEQCLQKSRRFLTFQINEMSNYITFSNLEYISSIDWRQCQNMIINEDNILNIQKRDFSHIIKIRNMSISLCKDNENEIIKNIEKATKIFLNSYKNS